MGDDVAEEVRVEVEERVAVDVSDADFVLDGLCDDDHDIDDVTLIVAV